MDKISVVILNYNTDHETLKCIQSIIKSKTKYPYEIIIVDNSEKKKIK